VRRKVLRLYKQTGHPSPNGLFYIPEINH